MNGLTDGTNNKGDDMVFNLTVNESGGSDQVIDLNGEATHKVTIFRTQQDAGYESGPFTLAGARQAAIVALGRADIIKAVVEAI